MESPFNCSPTPPPTFKYTQPTTFLSYFDDFLLGIYLLLICISFSQLQWAQHLRNVWRWLGLTKYDMENLIIQRPVWMEFCTYIFIRSDSTQTDTNGALTSILRDPGFSKGLGKFGMTSSFLLYIPTGMSSYVIIVENTAQNEVLTPFGEHLPVV